MSTIDWKTIKPDTVETIRHIPHQYIQALVQLNLWEKFTEAFYDDDLTRLATDALLKPKVRKNLLKDFSEEKIIHFLDTVTPAIRRHLLHILIEQADTVPVSVQVGDNLYKNMDKHLWVYHFSHEVFSLLPIETLRVAFRARIKIGHAKTDVMLFKYAADPSNSYDKKKFDKTNYCFLQAHHFAPQRYLAKRKAFAELIADLLIEGLNGYAKKKRKYIQFVLVPFTQVFFQFHEIWGSNKAIIKRVNEAYMKFPFHLTKKFNFVNLITCNSTYDSYFQFHEIIKYGILSQDDIIMKLIPKVFKFEFELPLEKTRCLKQIISNIIYVANVSTIHFYRSLVTISETQKDHPLAFIWPNLMKLSKEYFTKEFNDGNYHFLNQLARKLTTNSHEEAIQYQSNQFTFTYDFIMNLFNDLIRHTIDNKEAIVKESPEKYTRHMTAIFTALILERRWKDDLNLCFNVMNTPFFYLKPELRDEILTEMMCDPTGKKNLSVELTKEVSTVSLTLSLLFDDLKKLVGAIARNKLNATDDFGFQAAISVNFPPSLTQLSRKVEEYKGRVHIFERFLLPMLRHKNIAIARKAYQLYKTFVNKVLFTAARLNNDSLFEAASQCHYRLCRFLSSKVHANLQSFVIHEFTTTVVTPQSVYAGLKSNKDYATFVFDNLISKFPFTTDYVKVTMLPILHTLLHASYSTAFPGIGEVCGKLTTMVVTRLFNEMPAAFECPSTDSNHPCDSVVQFPPSEVRVNSIKALRNAQGSLLFPEKLVTRILKNYLKDNRKSVDKVSLTVTGLYIDPKLLTPELVKSFRSIEISAGSEPFLAVVNCLKEKIAQYRSEMYKRPTTRLIELLIHKLYHGGGRLFTNLSTFRDLPVVPFDYEQHNTENTYTKNVNRWFKQTFTIKHTTADVVKCFLPEDTFMYRLFSNPNLNFTDVDEVLVYKPLTKEQEEKDKQNPPKKQHVSASVTVSPRPDPSVVLRLRKNDQKQKPKRKPCPKCGHLNPAQDKKPPSKVDHEDWMDVISWQLIKPFLQVDAAKFCEAIKNDGVSLFNFVQMLYFSLKDNHKCEESLNLVSSLLDLCFKDLLIVDPEPTQENPNPKPTPTLFMDNDGTIIGSIPPFVVKEPKQRRGGRKPTVKTSGMQKYMGTKVLIAYLSSIMSLKLSLNHIDTSIFCKSLIEVLSLPPPDIKKRIGDDNYSFYADHLSSGLLRHLNFGKQLKDLKWATSFESQTYECFFRLFSCDAIHHNALEWINQLLLSISNVDERNAIISSFVSALTQNSFNYTLHARTRTVAWCLDTRYVGFPLPNYCIDYLKALAQDTKLHIDVRKTIAAGSVAYFKSRALVGAGTEQFDELFEILKKIYDTSKNNMAPTFCQLVRPKYCENLANESPLYRALMPADSRPESYLTPQNFGRLSMPHTGAWKEPHERFVSSFIGASLLSKDENVLQLAIQVLTKLHIRGGETAHKIAPFITAAFKEFNVLLPSAILINFMFNFCLQAPHTTFEGLIDGFVSIFTKTRTVLDEINNAQMKLFWTFDNNFRQNMYEPINKICGIFIGCLENVIHEKKDKEDFSVICGISKRILAALDGDKPVTAFYDPFDKLRNSFAVAADDDLMAALAGEPGEESLIRLLSFAHHHTLTSCLRIPFPSYAIQCFHKNNTSMTLNVIKTIKDWPLDVAQDTKLNQQLNQLFRHLVNTIGKDNEEFIELLPSLWKFAWFSGGGVYPVPHASMTTGGFAFGATKEAAFLNGGGGRGRGRVLHKAMARVPAPCAPMCAMAARPMEPPSFDHAMMLSNSLCTQSAEPKLFGALGAAKCESIEMECCADECAESAPEEDGAATMDEDEDDAETFGLGFLD
ncbi:hypothetical protein TRFO_23118 [Tritrichomonas foetus]|uniref:Uncharacterized protein n=1 Tax=Tritrichomonas foetus TaxID=1144522 RepID=A0A1J4KBW7_9EUKA|nr:hypothetical protein TRFO_23118 [Tritrichomonas foetus]|eukprot:OHT08424.1 hypothetical protein TRFO_23118 [Tritrichomonas foetus]